MCRFSLELLKQVPAAVGQKLIVANLPNIHDRTTRALAPIDQGFSCSTGVCIRSGWGVVFHLSRKQADALHFNNIGDETGASIFARFEESYTDHHIGIRERPDVFKFEVNGKIHVRRLMNRGLLGARVDVVAMPGQKWPPNSKLAQNARPYTIPVPQQIRIPAAV